MRTISSSFPIIEICHHGSSRQGVDRNEEHYRDSLPKQYPEESALVNFMPRHSQPRRGRPQLPRQRDGQWQGSLYAVNHQPADGMEVRGRGDLMAIPGDKLGIAGGGRQESVDRVALDTIKKCLFQDRLIFAGRLVSLLLQ